MTIIVCYTSCLVLIFSCISSSILTGWDLFDIQHQNRINLFCGCPSFWLDILIVSQYHMGICILILGSNIWHAWYPGQEVIKEKKLKLCALYRALSSTVYETCTYLILLWIWIITISILWQQSFCFAAELYKSNHPLILCTDDVGVFCTSLSAEYALASSTFGGCYVFCTYDLTIFSASFWPLYTFSNHKVSGRGKCFSLQGRPSSLFLLRMKWNKNWRKYLLQLLESWICNWNFMRF